MSEFKKRKPRLENDYALYRGDKFLIVGNVDEIARYLDVNKDTVKFLSYPSYRKRFKDDANRLLVIKLDHESS